MTRTLLALAVLVVVAPAAVAKGGKSVYVHGYTRKDGTYVQPHFRSPPGGGAYNPPPILTSPRTSPPIISVPTPRTSGRSKPPTDTARTEPPAATPAPPADDPGIMSVQVPGVRIDLTSVRYRKAMFEKGTRKYTSEEEYFKIDLGFYGSPAAAGKRYSFLRGKPPVLADEQGREYIFVRTDLDGGLLFGQAGEVTVPELGRASDMLVFTCPEPDATKLFLELPAGDATGGRTPRFLIPVSKILKD